MSVLIDEKSRVLVQGITGREGSFHALRNRSYGTQVLAGVTPGKGGEEVEGIPVYDTVAEAKEAVGADVSLIFVPPRFAADAVYEAADAGVRLIVTITEGIPVHEMVRLYGYVKSRGAVMIGPNCPGVISPGKANVGIMPPQIFSAGPVGLVSRSGTLTYQIANELSQGGMGQSTAVGVGGDPVVGSTFIDILAMFEDDPQTELIVIVGEIGGAEEEQAAEYARQNMSTPIVAYIAGFTAPPGKQMGHAGAIISGSAGTAQAKKDALEQVGIRVGVNPTQVAELAAAELGVTA